jgi:hypothetical protein
MLPGHLPSHGFPNPSSGADAESDSVGIDGSESPQYLKMKKQLISRLIATAVIATAAWLLAGWHF